jgi:pimeloyl-ACP methyl ester carboxylesterase
MPDFEAIVGRYLTVEIGGEQHRLFIEEAGRGIPLLCLHTAGNDSRQFRHVMNDKEVTDRFRVVAFDMPYHGRSTPPDQWWLKKPRLTTKLYLEIVRAVWTALEQNRRENWWYYSQSGPGVYQGDVHFYSNDWDAREDIKTIDTGRCKVALLTGEFDYSCTPAMTEQVAAAIKGSRYTLMKRMGHFPMIENYPDFRPYLLDALNHVAA